MKRRISNCKRSYFKPKMTGKKEKFTKLFTFALFSLIVGIFLFPSDCSKANEMFDLGEVVITATKVPQLLKDVPGSVTVITSEEIESSKAKNVGELLDKVAGIEVRGYGYNGVSTIILRGSSADQVLVMVDSRPVNLASSGDIDLSGFPLSNVERIEIVRGPFSALYGPGALGGVVNIITKTPPETGATWASLSYGSFNTSVFNLIYGRDKERFGYLFTAEKGYSDGNRENSWKDYFALSGKLVWSPSLVFSGGYFKDKKGTPGSLTWPTPDATQEDDKSWFDLTCKWNWRGSDFFLKSFLSQDKIVYENPDWAQKDTTENKTYGVSFQHAIPFGSRHNFIWGVDWREDEVDVRSADGTSRIGGKRKTNSSALYLQDEVSLFPDSMLVLGARYDNHSVYGSQLSPRVSFLYHLGEFTSIRSSWGRAFRPPTIDDLYWQEDWGGGMGLFGNPDLVPEKSSEYEVGIEHIFTPEVLGRITFFSSYIDDLISWVEVSPWRWEAQNVDKASIKGLEGEIRWKPLKKLSLSLNYTYLEARDEKEFKGNFLPYRPQNKLFLALDYKMRHNFQIHLEGEIVGERYADRENTEKLPPYSLLGMRLSFKPSRKYEIFIKGDNLLDEEYEDVKGYPMPGRVIKGGVEITL